MRAVPRILLIPLYHKIRIPYADVFRAVIELDGFLKTLSLPKTHSALRDLEWDIHLTTVNDLKVDLQRSVALSGAARLKWLTYSMPHFLWRATARSNNDRTLDVLFDATDIHTSNGVHGVIFYDLGIARVMTYIAKSPTLVSLPDIGVGALRILRAVAAGGSPLPDLHAQRRRLGIPPVLSVHRLGQTARGLSLVLTSSKRLATAPI